MRSRNINIKYRCFSRKLLPLFSKKITQQMSNREKNDGNESPKDPKKTAFIVAERPQEDAELSIARKELLLQMMKC